MALGGDEATLICLLLTAFTSSDLPLPTGHEPFCLFSLPYHTVHLYIIIVPVCLVLSMGLLPLSHLGSGQDHLSSSEPWEVPLWPARGSCCLTQSVMVLGRTLLPKIIMVPDYLVPEGSEISPAPSLENPCLASGIHQA